MQNLEAAIDDMTGTATEKQPEKFSNQSGIDIFFNGSDKKKDANAELAKSSATLNDAMAKLAQSMATAPPATLKQKAGSTLMIVGIIAGVALLGFGAFVLIKHHNKVVAAGGGMQPAPMPVAAPVPAAAPVAAPQPQPQYVQL